MGEALRVGQEFVEAFNAHDEGRLRALDHEDVVFEAPGDVKLVGVDASTEYATSWLRAFPDARITVHNSIAAGDWVVQEFTFEGTHEDTLVGAAGEIPATHRQLSGRGVQILRVQDGKIADTRLYYDQVQLLTQLGLMPAAAGATA